ncbi:MAG: methylmalonyl-CoA mutase family protein, partial [Alphaproteobacteria bacterium]|nr:methylmalonyl-CoA mutase family protein [Alphaproteobacteria bacterium]
AARDDGLVERELALVAGVAKGEENLIPPIRSAVRAGATLGEICEVLRQSFGLWRG